MSPAEDDAVVTAVLATWSIGLPRADRTGRPFTKAHTSVFTGASRRAGHMEV